MYEFEMTPIAISVLAIGMSVDALIASIGRGAGAGRPSWGEALKTGAIFGIVEAITPIIGWALGIAASRYIQNVDHWVAFRAFGRRWGPHGLPRLPP
jgi:putative Mn2+ efflux pump MntP